MPARCIAASASGSQQGHEKGARPSYGGQSQRVRPSAGPMTGSACPPQSLDLPDILSVLHVARWARFASPTLQSYDLISGPAHAFPHPGDLVAADCGYWIARSSRTMTLVGSTRSRNALKAMPSSRGLIIL